MVPCADPDEPAEQALHGFWVAVYVLRNALLDNACRQQWHAGPCFEGVTQGPQVHLAAALIVIIIYRRSGYSFLPGTY